MKRGSKRLRSVIRLDDSSAVRFRAATANDLATIGRFRTALFVEMEEHPPEALSWYGPRFARWYLRELRARRLWGVIAESETGRPLASGLAWLQPRPPGPRFPHTVTPYLLQVYTEPSARRHGIAAAIVSSLVETARRRGFPRVILHATSAGRSIYEELGFKPTTEMRIEFPRTSTPWKVRSGRGP
jgi:GNAT superfamily N-acetyltransferase